MNIQKITVAMQNGQSYVLPIEAGAFSSVIKDALLSHLLSKDSAVIEKDVPKNIAKPVSSSIKLYEPRLDHPRLRHLVNKSEVSLLPSEKTPLNPDSNRLMVHRLAVEILYSASHYQMLRTQLVRKIYGRMNGAISESTAGVYVGDMLKGDILKSIPAKKGASSTIFLSPNFIN